MANGNSNGSGPVTGPVEDIGTTFSATVTGVAPAPPPPPSQDSGIPLAQRTPRSISRFDQHQNVIMQALRVAVPAIVYDFQPGPPATVSVQIAILEPVQMNVGAPGAPINMQVVDMVPGKIIQSVPVVFPSAGGWSITMPIQKGDECLLVFSDACIDAWWQSGGIQKPMSLRRHSLSDAMAVFGLRSTLNGLLAWSTDSMQIRNDDTSVVIELSNAGQINITSSADINITSNVTTINGNLVVETGATGSFVDKTGQVITVQDGIITNIDD